MKPVALITGASGGIGFELASLFAKNNTDVVLVARNETKLFQAKQRLADQFRVQVYCVATDLSVSGGYTAIQACLKANNLEVRYLVNNAGFGDYGAFVERSMERYHEMLGLNVLGLTELTHHFAKQMVERGEGRILNVASTAGIQPDPFFAVYGASKAYVISFTEALHKELEKTGVTVTVLSPGATQTDFMDRADMSNAKLYEKGVMSAKEVAKVGFDGMMKGKLHVIPGLKNKVLGFFSSITPSGSLRLAISAHVMGKRES